MLHVNMHSNWGKHMLSHQKLLPISRISRYADGHLEFLTIIKHA